MRKENRLSIGQRAAVTAAFKLAGYEGELLVAPVTREDERIFLLQPSPPGKPRPSAGLRPTTRRIEGGADAHRVP